MADLRRVTTADAAASAATDVTTGWAAYELEDERAWRSKRSATIVKLSTATAVIVWPGLFVSMKV